MFQFTHPGKGATPISPFFHREPPPFQFTHPGKGATPAAEYNKALDVVSIHAPWEGCDTTSPSPIEAVIVSIHAPWEGCDLSRRLSPLFGVSCFNSRTLGRVRHDREHPQHENASFNSRTLGRVRQLDLPLSAR